jgi:hypothetical protein
LGNHLLLAGAKYTFDRAAPCQIMSALEWTK